MTVKELSEILAGLAPDMPVILAGDAGGNKFSPCADTGPLDDTYYLADSTRSGEVFHPEDGDGAPEGAVKCLLLWPTT